MPHANSMILIIAISLIIMLNAGNHVNFTCTDTPFITVTSIHHSIVLFNQHIEVYHETSTSLLLK